MIENTTISNAFLWDLKMAQTFCTLSDRWPSLPSAKYPPPGKGLFYGYSIPMIESISIRLPTPMVKLLIKS